MTTPAPDLRIDGDLVTIPPPAQPTAVPREHGSRIIVALEAAWAAIQGWHSDVPPVVMITGTGSTGHGVTWGHFGERRWTVDGSGRKERAHELFAAGELLSLGGRRTMQTLLHEAAHGLASVRDIKDTSSGYRYHNRRFVALAAELGLAGPASPAPTIGWSQCAITDATAQRYADVIEALDAARLPYVHDPLALALAGEPGRGGEGESAGTEEGEDEDPQPGKPKQPPTRFLVICGCIEVDDHGKPKLDKNGHERPGRAIQISRKSWDFGTTDGGDEGGLMCGRCHQPFRRA
ncbi:MULTISPECIES: hypothetical protein [unclassified Streptomyces]|uniref:hypothetical protein n=1 Tax=unclassified Streptomyces TaxID=2593676 RepID=UPI0035E23644